MTLTRIVIKECSEESCWKKGTGAELGFECAEQLYREVETCAGWRAGRELEEQQSRRKDALGYWCKLSSAAQV